MRRLRMSSNCWTGFTDNKSPATCRSGVNVNGGLSPYRVGLPKKPLFQGGLNPRQLSHEAASNRSCHAEKSSPQHQQR